MATAQRQAADAFSKAFASANLDRDCAGQEVELIFRHDGIRLAHVDVEVIVRIHLHFAARGRRRMAERLLCRRNGVALAHAHEHRRLEVRKSLAGSPEYNLQAKHGTHAVDQRGPGWKEDGSSAATDGKRLVRLGGRDIRSQLDPTRGEYRIEA